MPSTTVLAIQHPNSLSLSEILGITNAIVQADAPTVVTSLPISPTSQATAMGYVGLGELGLAMVTQITQAIQAAHAAKNPPPTKTNIEA